MSEMLSEHFSVSDFEYSDTARARKINNKMNLAEKEMAKHTCVYLLENIRKYLNEIYKSPTIKCVVINLTSAFRSLALNKAVGGVNKPNNISQHCKGQAADIVATIVYTNGKRENIPYNKLYEHIKTLTKQKKLYIDQCIQEASYNKQTKSWSYWVHVSLCAQIKDCRYEFLKFNNGSYSLDCILK